MNRRARLWWRLVVALRRRTTNQQVIDDYLDELDTIADRARRQRERGHDDA